MLLPEAGGNGIAPLCLEALRFHFHEVDPGLELGEAKASGVIRFQGSLHAVFTADQGDGRARYRRAGRIGDRPRDRAGSLALCHQRQTEDRREQRDAIKFRHA